MASNWEPAHSLVEGASPWGQDWRSPYLLGLAVARLPLCLWQGERGLYAASQLSFGIRSIPCSVRGPGCELEPFSTKFSLFLFFFSSLTIPQFGFLSHIISLRLASGRLGQVLTLRTDDATYASLSSPHSLVADAGFWATSPLAVAVRQTFCGFFCFPPGYFAF